MTGLRHYSELSTILIYTVNSLVFLKVICNQCNWKLSKNPKGFASHVEDMSKALYWSNSYVCWWSVHSVYISFFFPPHFSIIFIKITFQPWAIRTFPTSRKGLASQMVSNLLRATPLWKNQGWLTGWEDCGSCGSGGLATRLDPKSSRTQHRGDTKGQSQHYCC